MCEFKVAQIPSSRDVKQNVQHSKLNLYTVSDKQFRIKESAYLLSYLCLYIRWVPPGKRMRGLGNKWTNHSPP